MTISPQHTGSATVAVPPEAVTRARLREEVEVAQCRRQPICVIHLDLDGFHQINRRWGQHLGDQVLAAVGEVLTGALPPGSLLAAIEGDTFVAMVRAPDPCASRRAAEVMLTAVRQPVVVGGVAITIEASAGFATHA